MIANTMLALICSQRCPGDLILKTYDFARCIRGSGVAIVSGFHSPIEKDCLPILLRSPGPVILVLARRLSTTRLPAEWQEAIAAGRLLLLSPFAGHQKRVTAGLAAERNRFVAALADEVLIPYAAPGSKTEALAAEVLSSQKRLLTFASEHNAELIRRGAIAREPDSFRCKVASS